MARRKWVYQSFTLRLDKEESQILQARCRAQKTEANDLIRQLIRQMDRPQSAPPPSNDCPPTE